MTIKEYKNAVETLNNWAYAYYTLDNPIASDKMYDDLYFEVVEFEKNNSEFISSLSPTQRVGDQVLSGFEKRKHLVKMYSLDDVFNPDQFAKWALKIKKDYPSAIFYAEPKYDGLSLNLLYEDGELIAATTRGDGEIGEDVTKNIPYILGIPLHIEYKGLIEIRGEVVIFKSDFFSINENRVARGKSPFSNERNAASGSLRSFESESVKGSKLRFTPYGIGAHDGISFTSQKESYDWIISQGFVNWNPELNLYEKSSDIEDIIEDYNTIIKHRDNFPMLLDGVVIKVDQKGYQDDLGFATKYPKWGIAFKFPAEDKTTYLNDVIFQVGKTGAITPVGIVEPVNFDGVVVSRVTLHNFEEIERMGIKKGDKISIIRSGDVIPKIVGVFTLDRTGKEETIEKPSECPLCGSYTEQRSTQSGEESAVLYCSNLHCAGVLKGRLEYAVGKKALDIKDFGESIVEELIDRGLVTKLSGIYSLTVNDVINLPGFAKRKAEKLIEAIQAKRDIDAYRILNALDIKNIGERASKKLVEVFGERVFTGLSFDELISVEDIGSSAANAYVDYFSDDNNIIEVENLLSELNPIYPEVREGGVLDGLTFVITGTLSQSRKHYENLVDQNGGKLSGSVSKKTSYVLAGEDAGSKLEKAKKLDVSVIDESTFMDMLS